MLFCTQLICNVGIALKANEAMQMVLAGYTDADARYTDSDLALTNFMECLIIT